MNLWLLKKNEGESGSRKGKAVNNRRREGGTEENKFHIPDF